MVNEYFVFQSREGLAVGIFIILFAVSNYVLKRFMKGSGGIVLLVSLIVSGGAAWRLYNRSFYGMEDTLAFVLFALVIGIFIWIIMKSYRRIRR